MDNKLYVVWLIVAYLIGSISSAVWFARLKGVDIRKHGSGNAGATNILRVFGPKAALPVFAFDFLKGLFAVQLIRLTSVNPLASPELYNGGELALGVCAVLGHIFPIFASFKGGKGVATIAGVLTAISPVPMLIALTVFVVVFASTRYVSLGSICAAVSFPLSVNFLFGMILKPESTGVTLKIFSLIASIMIVLTHRKNIQRLRKGTENKISFKKKSKEDRIL